MELEITSRTQKMHIFPHRVSRFKLCTYMYVCVCLCVCGGVRAREGMGREKEQE